MTLPSQTSPDLARTLAEDLGCLECSYNLRGLAADGRCPECGFPIDRSVGAGSGLPRSAAAAKWAAWFGLACAVGVVATPVSAGLLEAAYSWAPPLTGTTRLRLWLLAMSLFPLLTPMLMWQARRRFLTSGPMAESAEFAPKQRHWRNGIVAAWALAAAGTAGLLYDPAQLSEFVCLLAWLAGYVWLPAMQAWLWCQLARQMGNAARMPVRSNWFRSVGRMLAIGAAGIPANMALMQALRLHSFGRWMDNPFALLIIVLLWSAALAFLLTGTGYLVLAGFWLDTALRKAARGS